MRNPNHVNLRIIFAICAIGATPISIGVANAQTTAPTAPVAANSGDALETIVVTAQLRSESAQDVPASMVVISGQALAQQNLNSLDTITQLDPSVHVGTSVISNDLAIRGIGSGDNASFDEAVGTFIDDIYHGRSRNSSATFMDLDHVEILKGPQSTFFGNNAIAGAFNIVTKAPGDTFEASARALYGMWGDRTVEAAAGGPITDTFGVRAVLHYDGSNGWLDDPALNAHMPSENNSAGRVIFLYKPIEDWDIKLKAEFSNSRSSGGQLQDNECPPSAPFTPAGFCKTELGLGLADTVGLNKNIITQNDGQFTSLKTDEFVLTSNYRHWGQTFTSVSGYYDYTYGQGLDIDGTPIWLASAATPETYRQYSQEFRIASGSDQRVEYLAGVYAQYDDLFVGRDLIYPFLTPTLDAVPPFAALAALTPFAQNVSFSQGEHSYAGFGSVTWHVTDSLRLTAGVRETFVNKTFNNAIVYATATQQYGGIVPFSGTLNPLPAGPTGLQALASNLGLGTAGTLSGSRSDNAFLPSAKLQYQIQTDVMAYFSYAKGFLAGGLNGQNTTGNPANNYFQPEHVNAYELGVKSDWRDHSLVLNVDVFRSDYTSLQVPEIVIQGPSVENIITNAASAITEGVEAEVRWKPSANWRVSGDVTYDDAHYVNYANASLGQLGEFCSANIGNPSCVATYGGTGNPGTGQNLSGMPTTFAPRWSGSVSGAYDISVLGYRFTPEVTVLTSSKYFISNEDPTTQNPFYYRLDARLVFLKVGGHWAVDLIGKNLADRDIITADQFWPASLGSALTAKQERRNAAIQFRYQW